MKPIFLLFVGTAVLAACQTAPKTDQALQANLPTQYEGSPSSQSIADVHGVQWWTQLGDPQLDALVKRGLSQNLSIQQAVERVRQSEADAAQTGVVGWFSGNANAQVTRTEGSGQSFISSGIISTGGQTVSSASMSLSILLDIFGKGSNTRKQAIAALESARFDVVSARLTFLSSLIGNYLDAQYNQQALELTRENIRSREETLKYVELQRKAGAATDVDVVRARSLLEESKASLPGFETGFQTAVLGLATLLDTNASEIRQNVDFHPLSYSALPMPDAGIPADVLRNRPDIRKTEESYISAMAGVGVARANMLPEVNLNGNVRRSSGDTTWSYGPSVSLPIFNQPRLWQAHKAAVSKAKQAELAWRASVRKGVSDVQGALTRFDNSADNLAAKREVLDSYQQVVDVSEKTYAAGMSTLLDLLNDKRTLASGEISTAQAERSYVANWVAVQIASGKGWEE